MVKQKSKRTKSISTQKRAKLDFPVARISRELRGKLGKTRVCRDFGLAPTVVVQTCIQAFVDACIEKMTEKERGKEVRLIRASHCASALADTTTEFYGIFPVKVAGIYRK